MTHENYIKELMGAVHTIEEQAHLRSLLGDLRRNSDRSTEYMMSRAEPSFLQKEKDMALPISLLERIERMMSEEQYQDWHTRKQFLDELDQRLSAMRTLILELAFSPRQVLVKRISAWIKSHVGEDILLEFGKNSRIISGARIIFGGRIFDGTLDKEFDSVFEQEWKKEKHSIEPKHEN